MKSSVNRNGNQPKRPNNEIHPSPIRGTFFVRNDELKPIRALTDVSTILYLDQNLDPVGNRGVSVIVAGPSACDCRITIPSSLG